MSTRSQVRGVSSPSLHSLLRWALFTATGYGVVGGENGETYYLGIIDVLEQWGGMKWPMQGAILKFFFRYVACGRWYNPEGITAVPPDDYAARFEEFLLQEVLGVDAPAPRARTWSPFW